MGDSFIIFSYKEKLWFNGDVLSNNSVESFTIANSVIKFWGIYPIIMLLSRLIWILILFLGFFCFCILDFISFIFISSDISFGWRSSCFSKLFLLSLLLSLFFSSLMILLSFSFSFWIISRGIFSFISFWLFLSNSEVSIFPTNSFFSSIFISSFAFFSKIFSFIFIS